ncbi:MAG: anion permease [Pseudomonadota bacterium]|nr:anion permease [Pseudomonadota bacterium]
MALSLRPNLVCSFLEKLYWMFRQDRLLHLLLLAGVILYLIHPVKEHEAVRSIDWRTIYSLAGLMLLTKGIERSGYLSHLGIHVIHHLHHERPLAIFLVLFAALGSMLLTNDIMLFIVVPLTLGLRKISILPVGRLVIFEALAVNTGSLFTPIGNPQNIFLWQQSHLSFLDFTLQMAPLEMVLLPVLLGVTALVFRNDPIAVELDEYPEPAEMKMLYRCLLLYAGFVLGIESGYPGWSLMLLLVFFTILFPRILADVDWSLIAVFILMFLDIGFLTHFDRLSSWLASVHLHSSVHMFLFSLFTSQVISNVPAALLLQKFLPSGRLLAYAVNVGGFGFVLGSLANLIALRMARERMLWLEFHFYSVPFLVMGAGLAWLLL